VSESKFRADPAAFVPAIRARDRHTLEGLITKPAVERALLERLRAKVAQYAVDFNGVEPVLQLGGWLPSPGSNGTALGKGDVVNVINELYESYIIPLTKEVEVG
jgi:chorismate mutase